MSLEVYKMNRIANNVIPTTMDGLIFFYTAEDRSINLIMKLIQNQIAPNNVFIMSFDDICTFEIENMGIENNIALTFFPMESELNKSLLPCFKEINNFLDKKNTIGIDISCMPIPIFTQIINFLFKRHNNKQIIAYYTEPEHYNLENLFDYSAYDGEIEIKVIPGFEGKTSQLDENNRVIFYLLGFELNYLNRIIPQETNPDTIIPINGFPSYFPKYKDISLINNNINFHEQGVEIIFIEANNPFETYNQMYLLKNKNQKYCIDIIPTGTKPMALGACLFALKNGSNDIRILFPYPSEYKRRQSTGSGILWEYIL